MSPKFLIPLLALASVLAAQSPDERTPAQLAGVGITEKLGSKIDLGLTFVAEDGYPHSLREYFAKGRPVVLNLVYYSCPMLCNLVLNGQVAALRELPWTPGEQYEVVTISIDPTENFGLAKTKKAAYLASFDKPAPGWHFLADNDGNAAKLASQVGFSYRLDPHTGQYAHAAAIFVLSPDGMLSRYLYGVRFKPLDLRLALTEAAAGKFGITDQVLLYCFHYDPASRSYAPFAMNFMRIGGAVALAVFAFVLLRLWRREHLKTLAARTTVTAQ